jgi:CRP/FNR family transcriptional regulator
MGLDSTLIENSKLLRDMAPESLHILETFLKRKVWPANTVVFQEGERGGEMYFIERGTILIFKVVRGDIRTNLATFGRGQCFGEMSLIDKTNRSASAMTKDPAVLLCLSQQDFSLYMERDPLGAAKFLAGILTELNSRIRHADEMLRDTIYWAMRSGGHLMLSEHD